MFAMQRSRNNIFDIARGIGILLVVIGHCYTKTTKVCCLINGFHMPFFFIISGMIYGMRENDFDFCFKKKLRSYIIPYLFFEIIWFIYLIFMNYRNLSGDIYKSFFRIVSFKGNIATWFLPCLFISQFIFSYCIRMKHPKILILILFFLGIIIPDHEYTFLALLRSFVGLGFFSVGYFFHDLFESNIKILYIGILFIAYYVLVVNNGNIEFYIRNFHNSVLFLIDSFIGAYLILYICRYIDNIKKNRLINASKKVLCYLGKNSLLIMCLHVFFIEFIRLLDYKLFNCLLPTFGEFEGLIFGVIVTFGCLLLVPFWNRYLGFLIGKKKN